jgi:hypothetical protein
MRQILVVANQTLGGEALKDVVRNVSDKDRAPSGSSFPSCLTTAT